MEGLTEHHYLAKMEQPSLYPTVQWQTPGQVIPIGAWSFMRSDSARREGTNHVLTSDTHTPSDGDGLGTKTQRSWFMVDVPQETTQGWQEQHFDEDTDTGKWWAGVMHGVPHCTHRGGVAICSLIQTSNLMKCYSKWDSGLTRFDGKVHLSIYCIEETKLSGKPSC